MTLRKRTVCALLSALLLIPAAGPIAAESDPSPEVRVLLRRLALTDRVDLTLQGRYLVRSAEGPEMLLPEGSQATVRIEGGELFLTWENAGVRLGASVDLIRQDSGEITPAVRFFGRPAEYPGDLRLTIDDGRLRPVLTIALEDYLQGVVPYEMSEYFPLEALKVQAVCARTYAMSRLDASRDYDVVDTTDDQVFRGLSNDTPNSVQAVRETDGLVITDGKKLIPAWYSASNGGQTELPEHVWSSDRHYACFEIKDDPYDTENPESMTRTTVLKKDGSNLPKGFLNFLKEAVLAEPEMTGFSTDPDMVRIDRVEAVELTDPKFASPSRVMTAMKITVSVSGRKPADTATPYWEPEPGETETAAPVSQEPQYGPFEFAGTFTLSFPLLPKASILLGLAISGNGNEIITVTEDDTAFTLVSGRYGHGVGMSQRGAQWMAGRYDMKFEEILAFYYPGMKLKQISSGVAPLPTPHPALAETPGPAATPTPRPTLIPLTTDGIPEGAWIASVEGIDDDSTLNLRAIPSPGGTILTRLYKHQKLLVLTDDEIPGWAYVRTDAIEGYVMLSFLEKAE